MQQTVRVVFPDELHEPVRSGVNTNGVSERPDLLVDKFIIVLSTDTPILPSLVTDLR